MLEFIRSPADLPHLSSEELKGLAQEIREFLIEKVSKSGGHLGPNLGVVELTLAIHRIFASPKDLILFDTGHQSYVHKILTGRAGKFDSLRQRGGIAGYPSRAESPHDVIENSHASTALSWGDGISRGFSLLGESDRSVVVVVGDGALTGGMAWEALNNISTVEKRNLIIILNDNTRSYSPTIGGLAIHLDDLRKSKDSKQASARPGIFEHLGMKYLGPIDGHEMGALQEALLEAKNHEAPIIVHVVTEKGRGHQPALADKAEKFHAVGVIDPVTGLPLSASGISWTKIFGDELVEIAKDRGDIVAITAAMLGPTGLNEFQRNFPERTIDVGIAEQHAVTSAAGMAFAGLHPVIALYSTFLNRAFDQLLLDVALHKAGVTFVLDRSGITGDDGPSHHGIWDLALTGMIPSLHVAAPRDGLQLRELLREAVDISDAPTLLRFPKGVVANEIKAVARIGPIDLLFQSESPDLLIVSVGALAALAIEAAEQAGREGVGVTVIDLRWVKPLPNELIALIRAHKSLLVLEDGIRHGGIASTISELCREIDLEITIDSIGVPLTFIEHSKRSQILEDLGITAQQIARSIVERNSSPMAEMQLPLDENASLHLLH